MTMRLPISFTNSSLFCALVFFAAGSLVLLCGDVFAESDSSYDSGHHERDFLGDRYLFFKESQRRSLDLKLEKANTSIQPSQPVPANRFVDGGDTKLRKSFSRIVFSGYLVDEAGGVSSVWINRDPWEVAAGCVDVCSLSKRQLPGTPLHSTGSHEFGGQLVEQILWITASKEVAVQLVGNRRLVLSPGQSVDIPTAVNEN